MSQDVEDPTTTYLKKRVEELKRNTPALQREQFTVESPHTCAQCEQDVFDGFQASGSKMWYLKKGLDDAVLAAELGCAFYEMILDFLLDGRAVPGWASDGLERSSMRFLLWFNLCEPWKVTFYIDFGESSRGLKGINTVGGNALSVWTRERDFIEGAWLQIRPNERDVWSQKSMKFARDSLAECISGHAMCRQDYSSKGIMSNGYFPHNTAASERKEILTATDLPLRLLLVYPLRSGTREVGLGVRLVSVGELERCHQETICKSGFASLSYCWGGEQSLKLNKVTHQLLTKGIDGSRLQGTLEDAIKVTKEIGLDYLWVDVLCIFQDNPEEMAGEISRMPKYYGANTVTICAASADRSSSGFLNERSEAPYEYGPFQLRYTRPNGQGVFQLLREQVPGVEPISKRAWTLQESLLSRRLLIFSTKQLFWHCMQLSVGCGGLDGKAPDHINKRRSINPPVRGVYPMSGLVNLSTCRLWELLVEDYMNRTLGFESDKLVAISALSAYVSPFFKARFPNTEYLAGHGLSPGNHRPFLRQLFWSTDLARSRRPKEYRSPSWSWASIDGPIYFFPIFTENIVYTSPNARILSSNIQLLSPAATFGAVTGGWITIQTAMRTIEFTAITIPVVIADNAKDQHRVKQTKTSLVLAPDTYAEKSMLEAWQERAYTIYFLQIWHYHQFLNSPMGLLLARATPSSEPYRRIGTFYFDCGMIANCTSIPAHKNGLSEESEDGRMVGESFFLDGGTQDVKIE